jgi:arylsulfatase A-like enzyme
MDALVGRLLDGLAARGQLETTTLMVFGDHGFVNVATRHHLNQLLREDGLLDVRGGEISRRHAWVAGNGGSAHVYVLDGAPRTTGERLAERFRALPGLDVVEPDEFAALGLPAPSPGSMQGDLILTAHDGVLITGHATAEAAAAAPVLRAAHGHAPSLPPMGAGFLMAGPGVREGVRLDEVSMLDLAPTAARLLGVELPGAQGSPLLETLAAR